MAKRSIYCADGTWEGKSDNTNVYALYKGLKTSADQLPFYDDGVGSDGNLFLQLVGGAFGTGLWTEKPRRQPAARFRASGDRPASVGRKLPLAIGRGSSSRSRVVPPVIQRGVAGCSWLIVGGVAPPLETAKAFPCSLPEFQTYRPAQALP
jgi:Uncharacterized alpha/beta hydrolase domain (DUF2235)